MQLSRLSVTRFRRSVIAAAALLGSAAAHAAAAPAIEGASALLPHEAAAVLSAQAAGERLPPALALELAKFLRDTLNPDNGSAASARSQFSGDASRALLALGIRGRAAPDASGLGITPFAAGTTLQQVYDVLGQVNTVGWLVGAALVPELESLIGPHNLRQIGQYRVAATSSVTTGAPFVVNVTTNVTVGQRFTVSTTLDVDALLVSAVDQALLSDTLVSQTPVSSTLAVTRTCLRISLPITGRRCLEASDSSSLSSNDKVLATHPSYRFAYPINAGQFATRLTASDPALAAYDTLGTLHSQLPRDPLASSPFTGIPGFETLVPGTGLADIATQAPPVNFFGVQTTSDASLIGNVVGDILNPTLALLGLGGIDLRLHAPVPPQGLLGGLLSLPRHRLGVTAGYRAAEVRAGKTNLLFVRWHNLGSSTVTGIVDELLPPPLALPLASAPATFYYDVPAGQHSLDAARVDAQGGVFVVDYPVAATTGD